MKELQDIARLSDRFISVELVDESLFDWNVKLHQVDKDSVLWQDMKETNTEFILLNLTFPDNFPFSPPFMRVLSPRLENGYVLDGGAICMELLTPRGWSSAYTVEAVMRQFAASLVKGQTLQALLTGQPPAEHLVRLRSRLAPGCCCYFHSIEKETEAGRDASTCRC
ncbi:PREDICTED: ubiquitin-conjugating enzyme E2Q-like protein 1 isoform X2 [Dipodomys ordii]|uniref:Ubiquitin-conjugating enzyme E2Q-like protein 1 n=1 Tax=Dipodomys ordii TaxID=10020 RepID=A0A1S3EXX7_DIPOR|nr:PREDICTED: ubiquitin-conjugating enzyme E2Q-like protein 1 isoform X2 [Dipodomys ordii]